MEENMKKKSVCIIIAICVLLGSIAVYCFNSSKPGNNLEQTDNALKFSNYLLEMINVLQTTRSSIYYVPCEELTGRHSFPLRGKCEVTHEYGKNITLEFTDMPRSDVSYLVDSLNEKMDYKFRAEKVSATSFRLKIIL